MKEHYDFRYSMQVNMNILYWLLIGGLIGFGVYIFQSQPGPAFLIIAIIIILLWKLRSSMMIRRYGKMGELQYPVSFFEKGREVAFALEIALEADTPRLYYGWILQGHHFSIDYKNQRWILVWRSKTEQVNILLHRKGNQLIIPYVERGVNNSEWFIKKTAV